MAKSETEARGHSSIETILRSLTDRPNVESTLILSRKDGSIIKANGFTSAEKRRRAESMVGYTGQTSEEAQQSIVTGVDNQVQEARSSPAEELAASVFQVVQIAGSLGSTLSTISADQEAEEFASRRSDPRRNATDADENRAIVEDESQVQLLRLRIKHREIIIFPDPQYLCCVVQRIGKQVGVEAR